MCLCSDDKVVAVEHTNFMECNIPVLDEDITYTQISTGGSHTVFPCSNAKNVTVVCTPRVGRQCAILAPMLHCTDLRIDVMVFREQAPI